MCLAFVVVLGFMAVAAIVSLERAGRPQKLEPPPPTALALRESLPMDAEFDEQPVVDLNLNEGFVDQTFVDQTCARCGHTKGAHFLDTESLYELGKCCDCPAARRCVGYVPKVKQIGRMQA